MQYELCWQLGLTHPTELEKKLTMPQLCGWIAWMKRRPRGDRRLDTLFALQTAHLRAAWVEAPEDGTRFLPQWSDDKTGPTNEAESELMQFGASYRI